MANLGKEHGRQHLVIQIQTNPKTTMFERCWDVLAELSHILAGVSEVTGGIKEEARGRNKHCLEHPE